MTVIEGLKTMIGSCKLEVEGDKVPIDNFQLLI